MQSPGHGRDLVPVDQTSALLAREIRSATATSATLATSSPINAAHPHSRPVGPATQRHRRGEDLQVGGISTRSRATPGTVGAVTTLQAAYPYQVLIDQNAARNRFQPEYELVDSGVFDSGRYWIVEVHYAKADPDDLLMKISVTNSGPDADSLHVLPTAWFRNTWPWEIDTPRPRMGVTDDSTVGIEHPWLGPLELLTDIDSDGRALAVLFRENESNLQRL